MRATMISAGAVGAGAVGAIVLTAVVLAAVAHAQMPGDAGRGKPIYDKRCSQCHGKTGDGKGPAAHTMYPRPRIFAGNSSYKFRTTPSGELPTDRDLYDVVTRGIPGTAMPAFASLPEQARWDVVAAVKSFNEDFTDPDLLASVQPLPELAKPEPVAADAASIEKGKEIFAANKCWQCHGHLGRGNGSSWPTLFDNWDKTPIVPTDFTLAGNFRGGHSAFAVFRTVSTGLTGTPMPDYRSAISVADRWHLANYITSLADAEEPEGGDSTVVAHPFEQPIPGNEDSAFWARQPTTRFATLANVIEAPRLYFCSVQAILLQAAYNQGELVLRVRWNDRSHSTGGQDAQAANTVYADKDGTIYTQTQHPDQLAIQFPAKRGQGNERPYFLFGDGKRPTNLWWWRADRERFTELNAKGFGSMTLQSLDSQDVRGEVSYDDGRYTAIVRRRLFTDDPKRDVQFEQGSFVPIAFSVWDGRRGEIGTRRALTTWHWLHLASPQSLSSYVAPPVAFLLTLGLLLGLAFWLKRQPRQEPKRKYTVTHPEPSGAQ